MRPVSYVNFHRGGSLRCETLVLTCIDFRFRKQVAELLMHAGYRDFDILALPGASHALVRNESRDTALNSIELSVRLHGVKRLIIVDHEDCGTCGGSAAFHSTEEEEKFHTSSLQSAVKLVHAKFPHLEVIATYMDWQQIRQVV